LRGVLKNIDVKRSTDTIMKEIEILCRKKEEYSVPVRRSLEHIEKNFSRKIKLSDLASTQGFP